jgi:hypothetical protein
LKLLQSVEKALPTFSKYIRAENSIFPLTEESSAGCRKTEFVNSLNFGPRKTSPSQQTGG